MPYFMTVQIVHYRPGENPQEGTPVFSRTSFANNSYLASGQLNNLRALADDAMTEHEDTMQDNCPHEIKLEGLDGDWDCDDCSYSHTAPEAYDIHREQLDLKGGQ